MAKTILPDQTGANGKILKSDGTDANWSEFANGEWITIDGAELNVGWTIDPAHPVQYRKSITGEIVFRGRVVPDAPTGGVVWSLPQEIKPSRTHVGMGATSGGSSASMGAVYVTVNSLGVSDPVSTVTGYVLDGFSYFLD